MIRRTSAVLAAILAAIILSAAPAWAAISTTPGGDRAGWYAGSTSRVVVPPCVTTTWRSAFWRLPKTPVGNACYKVDRSTWIPKAWPRVGYVVVNGERRPIYLRTV